MTASELKAKYLKFFGERGHAIVPGASLIPENDPTVLFTTAGMHPLVPYLLGEKHPAGSRITNVQRCIRTGDIDEVGDPVHLTFFEMLGNWSLGDYWKEETISWSFEFLTKELNIPLSMLAFTCFAGEPGIPKDDESAEIWKKLGVPSDRIFFLGREDNWWGPAGQTGPCGPDTEMFYWTGNGEPVSLKGHPDSGKWVEIWNDVFMQYNKTAVGTFEPLKQRNVDTGMGVERTTAVLNGLSSVYETELFAPIVAAIQKFANIATPDESQLRSIRIIADHLRAATFILAEGLEPSNVEKGYVLRRIIRRSVRYGRELGIDGVFTSKVAETVIEVMEASYPELKERKDFITAQLVAEEEKFKVALEEGLKMAEKIFSTKRPLDHQKFVEIMQAEDKKSAIRDAFEKKMRNEPHPLEEFGITSEEFDNASLTGEEAFYLYQSFGLPIEMISELAREKNLFISKVVFEPEAAKHQDLSRTASAGRFKGGLADHSTETTRLHTAHHLLLAALRKVLGNHVEQRGSNITAERLRIDFSHPDKVTPDQLKTVEDLVNQSIGSDLTVEWKEMPLAEAQAINAVGVFEHKYSTQVKVYKVFNPETGEVFSMEICGGPHVLKTAELGHFKILKEEASSQGIRRIKAILLPS